MQSGFRILQCQKNPVICRAGENSSNGRCGGDQFKVTYSDDQTVAILTCGKCNTETVLVVMEK